MYKRQDKDYEILSAFLINKVHVETINEEIDPKQEEVLNKSIYEDKMEKTNPFEKEYLQVVKQTEKIFMDIEGGMIPPILEIRTFLLPLVQHAMKKPTLILDILKYGQARPYMANHAVSVSIITVLLAIKACFNEKEIPQIALAAYLHNIGQLKVHPSILNKSSALTQEEFEEIQRHPSLGYNIIKKATGLTDGVKLAVLQHHEREDGSGYPNGIQGEQIHPYAKMIAITDLYYAMCSERPYKRAKSPFLVLEQIKNDSYGKLDAKFVYFFVEMLTSYLKIGARVMLSNGVFGEVVFMDPNSPTKPLINSNGELINLQKAKDIYIEYLELSS